MNSLREVIASCLTDYDPATLPVASAQTIINGFVQPVVAMQTVPVQQALGRVLAAELISPLNVPAHDNSAMDGYALRADDLIAHAASAHAPCRLQQIGRALAGKPFNGELQPGQCVRVMTGAVLPTGADTVVPQELCRAPSDAENGQWVEITAALTRGDNVRYAGEDLVRGKPVLARGRNLQPADLGLIASLGIGSVPVFRQVRVAHFSTGDEIASIGQPLAPGQVYDSNRYCLHGMLARLGVQTIDMGVIADDPAALRSALTAAATHADVVITTGGVSVGEADFIRSLMAQLGEVAFWKIAMRPGRPMAFGRIGESLFFGLPGNPVAVMVTFYQFVREALLRLGGQTERLQVPLLRVPSRVALRKRPGRTEYQRAMLSLDDASGWSVSLTGQQGSGVLRSMSTANCLLVLEHERSDVAAGDLVSVQLFDGLV